MSEMLADPDDPLEQGETRRSDPNTESSPPETDRPTRKERERERHRFEVSRAAERLLAQRSFAAITVQDIATEAEFSVGYLYKLYAGKDDIFASVIQSKHDQVLAIIEEAVDSPGDARQRIHQVIHGTFAWLGKNVAYAAGSLRSLQLLAFSRPDLIESILATKRRIHERLTDLCVEGIEEGVLERTDPQLIARTLRLIVSGVIREEMMEIGPTGEARTQHDLSTFAKLTERIILRAFAPEDHHDRKK
jgi:AcrR family transcriptional regulator